MNNLTKKNKKVMHKHVNKGRPEKSSTAETFIMVCRVGYMTYSTGENEMFSKWDSNRINMKNEK